MPCRMLGLQSLSLGARHEGAAEGRTVGGRKDPGGSDAGMPSILRQLTDASASKDLLTYTFNAMVSLEGKHDLKQRAVDKRVG